ncbi:FliG C-terminal domain-containing protein [Vibrio sp. PNB22_3_1]
MDSVNKKNGVDAVALMIMIMGPELGAKILKQFDFDEVTEITKALSRLEDVSVEQALKGITAFFEDFECQAGIVGGSREKVVSLLEHALGGDLAKDLVSDLFGDDLSIKARRLEWMPSEKLALALKAEHVDLQAMLFAYLKPTHAAEIMKHYPDEVSYKVMYSMSKRSAITSAQVETLNELIERLENDYLATRSKSLDGTSAVAGILNRYSGDKQEFLKYLQGIDKTASSKIEEKLVAFSIIFSQSDATLEVINSNVGNELWAVALKGMGEGEKEFLFNSMPSRIAADLKDQIVQKGPMPAAKVEQARSEILLIVRQLNADGKIDLSFGSESMVV